MSHPEYLPGYTKGVWLFNERYFFECHEILELLWLESVGYEKTHYQTLIHGAVCFVHWENGNRKGVLSLYRTFRQKAESLPGAWFMGVHLAQLVADMSALVEPYRNDPDLPLTPFATLRTPRMEVQGFEPTPVDEAELLILGRHEADES